jgi:hypothetical protein
LPTKFEREKQTLTAQMQDWKGQYETTKVHLSKPNPILPIRMTNRLKELLLNNTLPKLQNQALGDRKTQGADSRKHSLTHSQAP